MSFDSNNYFDIWNIFAFELVGNQMLAIILGLVLLSYFGMRYAIPFQVLFLLSSLYLLIMAAITGYTIFWIIIVLAAYGFFFWVMSRVFRRN